MCVLGCTGRSVATQTRRVFIRLGSALVRAHLEYCVPVWGSPLWRSSEKLERVHRRSTKSVLGTICEEAERPRLLRPHESEDLGIVFSCSP